MERAGAAAYLGLKGWWAVVAPAALMFVFFRWLGRASLSLQDDH